MRRPYGVVSLAYRLQETTVGVPRPYRETFVIVLRNTITPRIGTPYKVAQP
jgi:hypothetical protein